MNTESRTCQNCKREFVIEPADFQFYEKMSVPPPTWCPACRFQRRLAFMNDRELYKRTCDMCGKKIIAMYPQESKLKIYCNPCWWSDKWNAMDYGKEYDSSRPFLEQLKELNEAIPQMALELNYPTLVNSDYINHAATSRNCYLIFIADECDNVYYSEFLLHDKDLMDSTLLERSELCYEMVNGADLYKVFYSEDCGKCNDVYFSKDCAGCSDCFGCIGLRNKKYHFFNEPLTREEYLKRLKEFDLSSFEAIQEMRKKVHAFWLTHPHKFAHALFNVNTTGDYVYGAKNARNMYIVSEGTEDSRYCQMISMPKVKDAYDYTLWGNNAQRVYEAMIVGEGADVIKFSAQAWINVRNVEYSIGALSSSYIFGCANVRNQQYCILNRQYSKEEFEHLREKIVKDMNEHPYADKMGRIFPYGEFFSSDLSLFAYNETYAQTYFPLTKEEVEAQGFSWYERESSSYTPTLKAEELPDSILGVKEEILKEIIECSKCKKAFLIVGGELDLLRRLGLPLPRLCPNCRSRDRWNRVNKPELYKRSCECKGEFSKNGVYKNVIAHFHNEKKCPNEFETSYAPDRPEIVYCESCYNNEVI